MSIDRDFGEFNPANDPDKCGLEIIDSIEWCGEAYQFNETIVWKDIATGKFYIASDSGCSCPSPFEDYHSLADLDRLVTKKQLDAVIDSKKRTDSDYGSTDMGDLTEFRTTVLKAMGYK